MAKTESTAVNQLIELVNTSKPLPVDPSDDLMFSEPASPKKAAATRMTSTIPAVRGAGEVAPLPRTRAPSGTQSHATPPVPPAVRMSTAPGRAMSVPPITTSSQGSAPRTLPSGTPPPVPTAPNQTLMGQGSRPATTLPPPTPTTPSRSTMMGTRPAPSSAGIAIPPAIPARPSVPSSPTIPVPRPNETVMGTGARTAATLPPVAPSVVVQAMPLPAPAPSAPAIVPDLPPLELNPRQTALGVQPNQAAVDRAARASLPPPIRPSSPPAGRPTAPAMMPVAAPFEPVPPAAPHALDMTSNAAWFEKTALDVQTQLPDESWIGTQQVPKQSAMKSVAPKLILPMVGLVALGVFVGGYFAFDGEGNHGSTKKVQYVAPKTAEAPKAAATMPAAKAEEPKAEAKSDTTEVKADATEVKAETKLSDDTKPEDAKAEPKTDVTGVKTDVKEAKAEPAVVAPASDTHTTTLVDVRIDSTPSGATVMLVDRGKSLFLGSTPITASVDPSRQYDVVLTYADRPTQLEHLDPSATKKMSIVLGKPGNQAKAETPKVEAPKVEKKIETPKVEAKVEKKVETPKVEKKVETPKVEKAVAKVAETASNQGVLMIQTKPPTDIYIDGRPTGLTTPQRDIKLPAGAHKITLVNKDAGITKTVAVSITADAPTKVIQNLMK